MAARDRTRGQTQPAAQAPAAKTPRQMLNEKASAADQAQSIWSKLGSKMAKDASVDREKEAEELTNRIESLLTRSVEVQKSNNMDARRSNANDLKRLREELKTSGDLLGENRKEFEGLFEKLINGSVESTGLVQKLVKDVSATTRSALPSLDRVIGLAAANNPLIGFGLKVLNDTRRNLAEARNIAKEERAKKLEAIELEAEAARDKIAQLKGKRDESSPEAPENKPSPDTLNDGSDELLKAVEDVSKSIEGLKQEPAGKLKPEAEAPAPEKKERAPRRDSLQRRQLDVLVKIYEMLGGTNEELVRQEKENAEQNRLRRQAAADQKAALKASEATLQETMKQTDLQQEAARIEAKKESENDVASLRAMGDDKAEKLKGAPAPKMPDKQKGLLDKIFGTAIGEVVGKAGASLVGMGASIGAAVGTVMKSGGKLLRLAGKATLILQAVFSVFDFIDGFKNAEQTLGKTDPSTLDRVVSGVISVFSGLVGIVDDVTGLLGFQTKVGPWVKEKLASLYNGFSDVLNASLEGAVKGTTEFLTKGKDKLVAFFDGAYEGITNMWDSIKDFSPGDMLKEGKDKLVKKFDAMYDYVSDSIQELLVGGMTKVVEKLPDFLKTDGMKEMVANQKERELKRASDNQVKTDFSKQYDNTKDQIQQEKDKKEAVSKAPVIPPIVNTNQTNVSQSTTIGAKRIVVGNPDAPRSGGGPLIH